LRAATWRAARSGLEGDLVDPVTREALPAPVVLTGMLARLRPALEAAGDWDTVHALLEEALAGGSAAHRLRRVVRAEDLLAGTDLLAAETRGERGTRPASARRPRVAGPAGPATARSLGTGLPASTPSG
jgi:carboxylate-amine ligase